MHLIRTTFGEDYREATFWIQGETEKRDFVLNEPDGVNRWPSDFFGFAVQLVSEFKGGFPDDRIASRPTIVSEASLQEVVRWFPELTIEGARRRFRSNLEVAGVEPFREDRLFGAPDELPSASGAPLFSATTLPALRGSQPGPRERHSVST